MTKEEFLLDTIKYYSQDSSLRCASGFKCRYSPKTLNSKGDGCAIGRWLDDDLKLELDSFGNLPVHNEKVFTRLPEWMKELGIYFLRNMQELHDGGSFWTPQGLSEYGKHRVNNIISLNNLNIPPYE